MSPELGNRAMGVAFVCAATLIGLPFVPAVLWNGEIDERTYVSLEQAGP